MSRQSTMNFLRCLFAPKPDPNRPLVEYPSAEFRSIQEALCVGLFRYREKGGSQPVDICWQGQGGRLDSYLIREVRLAGSTLSSAKHPIQFEVVCREAGFDYDKLKTERSHDLNVESLSTEELARLIEFVFVKHLAMQPWDDSKEFCLGIEYVKKA
eukprot:TRINITY_DN8647_c0_g4_i1.p1 TRINITY_DN8647_c0_g4~~TRINITY_DN8647_c0_g4_i1.p1  ORF type:complete len:156 (-),score=11.94 TRINITY_DN8647_c0_g4_i1:183-650(-)